MRNVAVILAGGVGTRMGGTMPKQFFKVSGKTVLEHTISVFDNHPLIDEIAIVVHPNYLEKVEELCCINNFKKVGRILQGGSERYYSSLSAINAYASTENDINLIFHDSVRPLVTKRIISDCITMLGKYGAVDVAIPATDTIIKMNLNTHEIEDIPNRQFLYNGQTPQAFKLSVIREAYKRALVDPGIVCIGEKSLTDYSEKYWRRCCGVVMQEGFIFSDSIAKNIGIIDEELDYDRLHYAARLANIDSFINSLPLGYETKIGSEGCGLSNGQKQRILIARAIYKNPNYIFLDEATNSLDTTNETIIMENLQKFYSGRTVVIVAHRLSTVRNADKIIVLHHGEIVEVGTHETLISHQGVYYQLIENQLELNKNV